MDTQFEYELSELKQRLLALASHAERAVNRAVQALNQRDLDLALKVKDEDPILDRLEAEIDDLSVALLAHSPEVPALRFITVAVKITINLERVGDEAAKVAKRARDLCRDTPLKVTVDMPRMARLALAMLKDALDAFVNGDAAAARAVIPSDREVDSLNKEIRRQLVGYMKDHPDAIERCLHVLTAAKCLERIADHATNIAEEVIYLYEAHDLRLKRPAARPDVEAVAATLP